MPGLIQHDRGQSMVLSVKATAAEPPALAHIAELAASIANSLGQPDRGRYKSERPLRQWLTDDGISFAASELAPALALLDATGRFIRPNVERGNPRPDGSAARTRGR
jgi:hypothetical protein